ncbi:hypothetical protein BJF90_23615 [Pseudonocardia sp. CNS-004]|nr:hypothetical protein BJF90_23615 [Pseudonocardia sp. CNS-004]
MDGVQAPRLRRHGRGQRGRAASCDLAGSATFNAATSSSLIRVISGRICARSGCCAGCVSGCSDHCRSRSFCTCVLAAIWSPTTRATHSGSAPTRSASARASATTTASRAGSVTGPPVPALAAATRSDTAARSAASRTTSANPSTDGACTSTDAGGGSGAGAADRPHPASATAAMTSLAPAVNR